MSHVRRRFLASGVAVLTGLAGLNLAPSAAQGVGADDTPYNVKTPTRRRRGLASRC
jgi:hypothetical protein